MRERAIIAAGALLWGIACGGADTGRPTERAEAVRPADPGSGPVRCDGDAVELWMLDDFELGAAGAGWSASEDVCDNWDASEVPVPAERVLRGTRCGSAYAIHCRTRTLRGWGGKVATRLAPAKDAARWDGLAFWARTGPGARTTLRVGLRDKHTDGGYRDASGQPPCNPDHTPDTLPTGCDEFGAYAIMNGDWQQYVILFDEFRQAGWGRRAPFLDVGGIRSVSFTWGRGRWDVWVDDLAFYRRPDRGGGGAGE